MMTSTCADAIRVVKKSTGAALTPEQAEILSHMSIEQLNSGTYCVVDPEDPWSECGADPPPSATAKTIRISGVNVQIVNGSGATDTVNGLGNLIVGYQEERIGYFDDPSPCHDTQVNQRGGSHNVIVGRKNSYTSWGSAVVGDTNTASQRWACAVGGRNNHAKKEGCFVGGGSGNYALEDRSAIVGGSGNCVSELNRGLLGTHQQSIGECYTDCFLWDE